MPTGERQLRLRIIGPGRAGRSMGRALQRAGWALVGQLGRGHDLTEAASGVDLVLIATPDLVIAEIAQAIRPDRDAVVAHLAGSLGTEVLAPHPRRAAIHPLVALPDEDTGLARLTAPGGVWFAVTGDPLADTVVDSLGGRRLAIAEPDRTAYHAAAVMASNHLVALLGQVQRVAASIGVPLDAYLDLVRATVDNVAALGPAAALTGPAARGDWETIAHHLAVLPPEERAAYEALADQAARLSGRREPVPVPRPAYAQQAP